MGLSAAVSLDEMMARSDVWCADRLASATIPAVSSGFPVLDAELPGGGWPRGALTEILVDGVGLGECSLVMPALGRMREENRWSLLVAPPYGLQGPAWMACGIDLTHLVVVSPTRQRDVLWATEHALSSGAVGTVLCWAKTIDAPQVRRLQVAVAGSNTLAFLFRPARAGAESSAASLRLVLSAATHGALAVDLLKRRGTPCTRTLHLDVPRPLKWHEDYEFPDCSTNSALARSPSTQASARSQRPLSLAWRDC